MIRLATLLQTGRRGKIERSVIPACLPFSIEPPGAREAILLLHGFTGNPAEMATLGKELAEAGYAVHAPRYPGHGTNREDFYATDAADWLRRAFDARLELGARFEKIHVVGHSMGGVIAAAIASAFPTGRLALLAPAFLLSIPHARLTTFFAPFRKELRRNRLVSDVDRVDPVRAALHEEYWKDDLILPTAQLVAISRLARRNLVRVEAPTLIVAGSEDRAVPVRVCDFVKARLRRAPSVDVRVLEGADHHFPFDGWAGKTARLVADWMAGE